MTSMFRTTLSVLILAALPAMADARSFTGARGGTASGTIVQQGTTVSGQGTATSARGRTVSASGSAVYHPVSGTVDGQGSVTGPQGATYGGTVAAGNGSATLTGDNGTSKTFTQPPQ